MNIARLRLNNIRMTLSSKIDNALLTYSYEKKVNFNLNHVFVKM